MNPEVHDLSQVGGQQLAKVFDLETSSEGSWRPDELGAILEHQLSAPVVFDLAGLKPELGAKIRLGGSAPSSPRWEQTFAELFHASNPSLELLLLVKQFAKVNMSKANSNLPRDIAAVLYYAAIIVALSRCHDRITGLNDDSLRKGCEWVLAQPWVDQATIALFTAAHTLLSPRRASSSDS